MTAYVPILIIDEGDSPKPDSMSIREFLSIIDEHVNNIVGANYDNVFVSLHIVDYEDDNFHEVSIPEIRFSFKNG